jgi:hypothetical protein
MGVMCAQGQKRGLRRDHVTLDKKDGGLMPFRAFDDSDKNARSGISYHPGVLMPFRAFDDSDRNILPTLIVAPKLGLNALPGIR